MKKYLIFFSTSAILLAMSVWILVKLYSFDASISQIGLMLLEQKLYNIPNEVREVDIDEGDSFAMGDSNAPHTTIMFFDYECDYCKMFFNTTFPQIEEKLINTGKLRFVFRHFPIEMHPDAYVAAQMAEQARKQGKFLAMHRKLMETYNLTKGALEVYAGELDVDTAGWQSNPLSIEKIDRDKAVGVAISVRGTPSFVTNGRMQAGMRDYADFKHITGITD